MVTTTIEVYDELIKIDSYSTEEFYRFLHSIKNKNIKIVNDKIDDEDIVVVDVDKLFNLLDDFFNKRNKDFFITKINNEDVFIYKKPPENILKKYDLQQKQSSQNNTVISLLFDVKKILSANDVFKCSECNKWSDRFDNELKSLFQIKDNIVICMSCVQKKTK